MRFLMGEVPLYPVSLSLGCKIQTHVQGYLTNKKTKPRRTLS